jgi:hypothetical protein
MTYEGPFTPVRRAVLVGLAGLVFAGAPSAAAPADPVADERRLQALEQRLDDLTRRLEQLESREGAGTSTPTAASSDGIRWSFDAALSRSPFNVTHQSFDRGSGRFDLLLKVVEPIPNPVPWQVDAGAPLPVAARLGLADGTARETIVFRLARGPKLDPGAVLHLEAHVPIEQAAAISGVSVGIR